MVQRKRAAAGGEAPTKKDMIKAEREVGENIPEGMIGLDTEDVGDVDTSRH